MKLFNTYGNNNLRIASAYFKSSIGLMIMEVQNIAKVLTLCCQNKIERLRNKELGKKRSDNLNALAHLC